jgi:hypothetical protein
MSLIDTFAIPLKVAREVRRVALAASEISGLVEAVSGLHAEVAGLRSDLQTMPVYLGRLADDVEVVRGDLDVMKVDLVEAGVAPQLDALRTDLSALPFVTKT